MKGMASRNLERLSIVAIATRHDDPSERKTVRVDRGRRHQTGYDCRSERWDIERLPLEEGAAAIAGLSYRDMGMSGEPWTGVWVSD